MVVVKSVVSVSVPLTVALLPSVTPGPLLFIVKLLKAVVLVSVCAAEPLKVTVLVAVVNVPLPPPSDATAVNALANGSTGKGTVWAAGGTGGLQSSLMK